jgi:hypothetical protein
MNEEGAREEFAVRRTVVLLLARRRDVGAPEENMSAKKANVNPERNPHLFLKWFRHEICDCKPKIAVRVLNILIGVIPDAELKRVARKASKHFLGKKVTPAKRDEFRRKCLRKLRAMRTRERRKGAPHIENVED